MTYPMEHKIKKPKAYTPSANTNIRETLEKFKFQNQTKSPVITLQYPLNGAK